MDVKPAIIGTLCAVFFRIRYILRNYSLHPLFIGGRRERHRYRFEPAVKTSVRFDYVMGIVFVAMGLQVAEKFITPPTYVIVLHLHTEGGRVLIRLAYLSDEPKMGEFVRVKESVISENLVSIPTYRSGNVIKERIFILCRLCDTIFVKSSSSLKEFGLGRHIRGFRGCKT